MPKGVYKRKTVGKTIESNEVFSGAERAVDRDQLIRDGAPPAVETATEEILQNTEALEKARFMREELEVHLHEGMNDQDSAFAFVGVQGRQFWMKRGGTYRLPREHVEVLARAKSGRVVQSRHIAPDGSQTYIEKEVLNLQYPFSVIHDPSGSKGAVWLREILKQAS